MDVRDIVSTEYTELSPDARVSKLVSTFEDPSVKGAVVTDDGDFEGVVTRRQLAASHHPPDEKVGSLTWPVTKLAPDEEVREAAGFMLDSQTRLLPVFENQQLVGVVTVNDLLEAVREFLDAATVEQAHSDDLVTVHPDTTFGEALHTLRDHSISHLPVAEDGSAVGILSLYDVIDLTTQRREQSQGGDPPTFDEHGGEGARGGYRSHGGFGAREGERERLLDLPVRDVMVSPVRSIRPEETLERAVEEMFEAGASSLVVDDGSLAGIITKTDVLEALTWGTDSTRAVQVAGIDLVDDVGYEEIVEKIDALDRMHGEMNVLDAKIHLTEHQETQRGVPLLFARIRLHTDRGMFLASGEGYGAMNAINEARDALKDQIREDKTYGKSKKHPDEEFWEKRFGWWLSTE